MSKKIKTNITTKLSKISQSHLGPQQDKSIGIITSKKTILYPKSFRLTSDDVKNLNDIAKEVNKHSRSKISETKVLQSLIQLGTQTSASNILKALKEIL